MADASFPSAGVSCAFLVSWKDELLVQGRISASSTTTDVCEAIVKPATVGTNGSFVDLLVAQSPVSFGRATHFVSHAWKYCFCDLVAAIEIFALSLPPSDAAAARFWVDLLVVDQHNAPSRPHTWWSTTFVDAIRAFGKVVLVFQPLLDPIPLTRAWCLWEIFTAVHTNATIHLAMPTEQWTHYRVSLRENYHAVLATLAAVDARRAEAWNPVDRDEIFRAIEAGVGFDALNGLVRRLVGGILLVGGTRHACQDGNLDRLRDMLALGPDVNTVSTFLTPLGVAADMNAPVVADFLVTSAGAAVDGVMAWGHTPLHVACRAGHVEMVMLLLRAGANAAIRNDAGRTALEEAEFTASNPDASTSQPPADGVIPPALVTALDAAKNALNSLTRNDVGELKSMGCPPEACMVVVKCIVLILEWPAPKALCDLRAWWEIGKRKLFSDPHVVAMLQEKAQTDFPAMVTNHNHEPKEDVLALADDPKLDPTRLANLSRAMWAMGLWVRAYIVALQLQRQRGGDAVDTSSLDTSLAQAKAVQAKHMVACVACAAAIRDFAAVPSIERPVASPKSGSRWSFKSPRVAPAPPADTPSTT
ncbi:Aste57867_13852 [Aphanomyces stellatus]|uniref:Aste57867_13852 protein n=1 Tax=Aphanomyces stellatus TaxID=120398 RepID=A0A485KZH4_9STRA|nr:hypothetical protein As57867_013801 [Aphanomyces stellatus]VFT90683.1 Aste57867_13852 [Aphanomyces stellatus]